MKLWRPVGLAELGLIFDTGMKRFPPRLPEQPIFYPVLNAAYAQRIASEWNTKEDTAAGYVTSFLLDDEFAARYEIQVVGGQECRELWVPSEELSLFNERIQGLIEVSSGYFGPSYRGPIPESGILKGIDATDQFELLAKHLEYSSFDVWHELHLNKKAVFLNYLFWLGLKPKIPEGIPDQDEKLLKLIRMRWQDMNCGFGLPGNS